MMARRIISLTALLCLWLGLAPLASLAATYTVTNTNDSGAGSFRQAILNANGDNTADVIIFNISGPGPYSIKPLTPIQDITGPVTIDATTQPGYAGTPIVELNGAQLGGNANGLHLKGGNSTVRGLVINSFGGAGVDLDSHGGDVVQGNFIGTDLSGTNALGNGVGILINDNTPTNQIGGVNPGEGNVISGNAGYGIQLKQPGGNVIQGNFIGTDLSGTLNLGNASAGVYLNSSSANIIGGPAAGAGNTIAFNTGAGVQVAAGTQNQVRGNSIFSNGALGIDLGSSGVTPNDSGDGDKGANDLQNFPVLSSVTYAANSTIIHGTLNSAAQQTYQIDLYSSPTCDASGYGEGKTYLGSVAVTTDASGNAAFNLTLPMVLAPNTFVSATATDPMGNTSEFAACQKFVPVNPVALSLSVTASTNATMLSEQLSYSITVTNSGTNAATGVTVTDWFPSMNYVYATMSVGTFITNGNSVAFNLGTLAPGATAVMKVYVSPQALGILTNVATVSQNEYNLTPGTGSAVVDIYQPAPPSFKSQPAPQLLNLGGLLNLVADVLGPPGIKYQWRLNGANIPGATNSTYRKAGLLASDCGAYSVVVSDQFGATTSQEALISLNGLVNLPGADNFAQRAPLLNLLGLFSYNNVNATSEPGEPMHAGIPGGKSVWFTWTPLLSGVATFDTFGSSFDTLLAVYTGNNLTNLTEVASSDDGDGYYRSRVVFNAVGGTTYSIAIDGAYGASGTIILNSSEDILSTAVPRINAQPVNQIVGFGGTATFSIPTISGASYQWLLNDVSLPGATSATLQIPNVSAANVGLYRVRVSAGGKTMLSKPASLQISLLDGAVNANALVQDKFQAAGLLIPEVFGGVQSVQTVQVSLSNRTFSQRLTRTSGGNSRGYSSTQVFSTYGGGTQSGEPNHCDQPGGSSAWTSVQAVDNGIMEIDTDGSNFATILGVYTGNGNDFSSLVPVACDVSSGTGGTNSMVTFAATSNTVYYVAVDGVNGAYGTVVLHANLSVPPSITAQPASHTVSSGSTVVLTATVNGYPTPQCQWWCNGWQITGQTNGTLTLTNFQAGSAGNYQMIAANNVGSAGTAPASILLNGPAHLDQSGMNATNRLFQMRLVGIANTNYVILASTNLITWTPIATNASGTGLWTFTDTHSTNFPGRYYRAKLQ